MQNGLSRRNQREVNVLLAKPKNFGAKRKHRCRVRCYTLGKIEYHIAKAMLNYRMMQARDRSVEVAILKLSSKTNNIEVALHGHSASPCDTTALKFYESPQQASRH